MPNDVTVTLTTMQAQKVCDLIDNVAELDVDEEAALEKLRAALKQERA